MGTTIAKKNTSDAGAIDGGSIRPFSRITIIGVGLLGGSIAAACKSYLSGTDICIRGIDIDANAIKIALEKGYLDSGAKSDDSCVEQWLSSGETDLIILAVPASAAEFWFERIASLQYDGVITDVASTKGPICEVAARVLAQPERYIPGHPMAGSEVNGIDGARATLFNGAHWILCPDAASDEQAYLNMHDFVTALGARCISVSRHEHDQVIALVSHVPHMVASALVQLVGRYVGDSNEILRLAAGGFKDTTRIAAGSAELWSGIALDNRLALSASLSEIREIIGSFEMAIAAGDERQLESLLEKAADLRKSIPSTWVPDSQRLVQLRISMANRSGVIAEVTGYAAKAGCNIQSIDIDHINDASAILDLVLTDEGDLGRLTKALIDSGFDISLRPLLPDSN